MEEKNLQEEIDILQRDIKIMIEQGYGQDDITLELIKEKDRLLEKSKEVSSHGKLHL